MVHYKDDGAYKITGMYGKPECRILKDIEDANKENDLESFDM